MASGNERRSVPWLNEQIQQSPQELVLLSEELYQNQVDRTADSIAREHQIALPSEGGCSILLVSGPSASTKTTTAGKLSEQLEKRGIRSVVLSLDNFFIDRRKLPKLPNGDTDFESVATLDLPTLHRCFRELLQHRVSDVPIYDFVSGSRSAAVQHIELLDNTVVIVEGIHALNPAVISGHQRESFRKIFISPNSDYYVGETRILKARDVRLVRRIVRDFFHRGNTVENTMWMWENVVASERVNILPFKAEADYIIDSTILYEPNIYVHWMDYILDQSIIGETYLPKVAELTEALSCFRELPSRFVPADTVLHEFLQ